MNQLPFRVVIAWIDGQDVSELAVLADNRADERPILGRVFAAGTQAVEVPSRFQIDSAIRSPV